MNQEPKSIWKKSWPSPWWLRAWVITAGVTFLILLVISQKLPGGPKGAGQWLVALTVFLVASLAVAALAIFLWLFIRWLFCRHNVKRTLFGLACFITLIALIYAEEDWRGRHDWNQFKQKWDAKGETFDFQAFVPPSVPDDQNLAFSPVWIAADKFNFLRNPERARAWYDDRINDSEVTKLITLLPIQVSGLTGTNLDVYSDSTPEMSADWAAARIADLKPWQSYYRDMGETNPAANIPIASQPQSAAADVLLALSKYDPVINQLRVDSARPNSRFPISYGDDNKAAILLPHLAFIRYCAQVLQLKVIADLQSDQSAKAVADVKLMMRLTASIRTEPFFISQLVRIFILQLALQPIYESLAEHQWTDAQLVEINSELEKLILLSDCRRAQKAEMAFNVAQTDFYRRHRDFKSLMNNMGFNFGSAPDIKTIIYQYAPGGWFYQSALHSCQVNLQYLPAVDTEAHTVSKLQIDQANQTTAAAVKSFDVLDCIKENTESFSGQEYFIANFIKKFAYAQASVDLARVAIALERCRLAHGEYPETLDSLIPKFITQLPHDVIGGKPLHYRRTNDGSFVLYSVGWNETDDGGVVVYRKKSNPPSVDINQGDWVWRYPEK